MDYFGAAKFPLTFSKLFANYCELQKPNNSNLVLVLVHLGENIRSASLAGAYTGTGSGWLLGMA